MSIEVLLMQDMDNLGNAGTVVRVAPGYARNYLFVNKLAEPVTEAARRRFEKIRVELEAKRAKVLADARKKAAKLKDASVTIRAKTTDGEALFGSVTAQDIAQAICELGTEVDKSMVHLNTAIKTLGTYDVVVKLHHDVSETVKVWVVQE